MTAPLPLGIRTLPHYRVADEAHVVAMIALSGWAIDARQGREAHALREAASALDRWVSLGLAFERDARGARRFDIAEVVNFAKGPAPLRGDGSFERFVRQARTLVLLQYPQGASADTPPSPGSLPPAQFVVTLHRELPNADAKPGDERTLQLPMPIEDATLSDVLFDVLPPSGTTADVALASGCLDIRLRTTGSTSVACGARWSFVCDPARASRDGAPLADADRDLYTQPVEGVVSVSARVRALADEVGGTEREPWTLVRRFFEHAIDRLWSGVLHEDELAVPEPVDRVLDGGWCDSRTGAALVVALCRARGIPARLVSGYVLMPLLPAERYWLEAWIDGIGWTPWDFTASDLSAHGRDAPWREHYAGQVDYRMKTRILPHAAGGFMGVPLPAARFTMSRIAGEGVEIATFDHATGNVACTDRLVVRRMDAADSAPVT